MKFERKLASFSGLLLGISLLCVSALCEQARQALKGTVMDQSRGPVPNATVTLVSDDRIRTTKSDADGHFAFASLTSKAQYLEVSSAGFFTASVPIADTTVAPIPVTLVVGSYSQCEPLSIAGALPPIVYEVRSGQAQVIGRVEPIVTLGLWRADLNAPLAGANWANRSPAMIERQFKEVFVGSAISANNGDFQFADLEPGWYKLVAHGHVVRFWVARETLTKLPGISFPTDTPSFSEGVLVCPSSW